MEAIWPFLSCKRATIEMVSQDMYPLKRALINTTVAKCFRSCMAHCWPPVPRTLRCNSSTTVEWIPLM